MNQGMMLSINASDDFVNSGKDNLTGYNISASNVPISAVDPTTGRTFGDTQAFMIAQFDVFDTPSGILLEQMKSCLFDIQSPTPLWQSPVLTVSVFGKQYKLVRSTDNNIYITVIEPNTSVPILSFYDAIVHQQRKELRAVASKNGKRP